MLYLLLSSLCNNFPYILASTHLRTEITTMMMMMMMMTTTMMIMMMITMIIIIIIIVRVLSVVAKLQKVVASFVSSVRPARQIFAK